MRKIAMRGNPLSLVGRKIHLNAIAPNFQVVNSELETVKLDQFTGKIKVLTSFPSLDTPVCDLQVKRFNQEATAMGPNVIVIGISKDLPFAQQRFCAANSIKNVLLFSDYRNSSFGLNYGVLIKENNLLARAVIILDSNNVIRSAQIVDELTAQPNYEQALKELEQITHSQPLTPKESDGHACKPCEGKVAPLAKEQILQRQKKLMNWQLLEEKKLMREFTFNEYMQAKYFFDIIAMLADEQGHHPTLTLSYNKLKVTLTTHSAGGLTENDFIMAHIIDDMAL